MIKEKNMKRYSLYIIFLILMLSSCDIESFFISAKVLPDDKNDNSHPGGNFKVGIENLKLTSNELATIPGRNPTPALSAIITPVFATEKQLRWTLQSVDSIDPVDVAVINADTGEITVRTEAVDKPLSTIVRVESIADPSKYDTCILTIYPLYPATREWTWPASPGTTGDLDQGDGGTLLFGTGNSPDYTNGNEGAGVYVIDPADPYRYGIDTPNGGPRAAGTFTVTTNPFTGANRFLYPASPSYPAHIRTSGNAMRVMRIAALFAPFTIVVNYQSNDAGERNADIRVGDKEGWRIEGEASTNDGSGARTVWYSYEADPQAGIEEFVPLVFIEAKQGLRLYAVYVLEGVYELNSAGKLVPRD